MFNFINENTVDTDKIHMTEIDFHRRNSIIFLLSTWGLLESRTDDISYIENNKGNIKLTIIPFKEKSNYKFTSKFQLGKKE